MINDSVEYGASFHYPIINDTIVYFDIGVSCETSSEYFNYKHIGAINISVDNAAAVALIDFPDIYKNDSTYR